MEVFKNEFHQGRNSDLSPDKLPPTQYTEANNVELDGDGAFASLRNINGTTLAQQLSTSATFTILQAIPNKYLISGALVDCITVFSVDGTTFKVQCYDVVNDTTYDLFSETVPAEYATSVKDVDAATFPENGTDFVYYTDNYLEIRYLKCEIPDPYSANFLSAYDISLLRRGALGTITSTVDAGGTLLSGTYQFSYRMADPTNKRFTKWSTPTNPIHVYDKANSTTPVYSSYGLVTNRKISLTITPSEEETDEFDYLQIAVIENTGVTAADRASLLEIEAIASTSLAYDYKSNSRIDTIPLTDITVDLAQIRTAKTLNIKDNRLFAGNITYYDLELDNGTPAIGSGTIITQASSGVDSFSSDDFASKYRGHWRGEVYRYGVVYEDQYGNKSPVYPLDLSGVTGNTITPGLTDLKFPSRTNGDYTLFNSSGQIQSLGLRLTGLNNHPSWARKLEIVRVERTGRFKNILFQSPIIPMTDLRGIGALEDYPNVVTYASTLDAEKTYENATPMTSGSTLIPKNLMWPELRDYKKVGTTEGSGTTKRIQGEVELHYNGEIGGYGYSMIFPDQSMYQPNNPYQFTGAEKLDFVDLALMKVSSAEDNPEKDPSVVEGDDVNTSVSATFYALANNQYFYSAGHSEDPLNTTDRNITDSENFDNLATTDSVSGKSVMDYEAFQTEGIELGFKPNIQRSTVIKIGGSRIADVTESNLAFSAATWNGYSSGGALSSASASLKFEANDALTNKYITEYSGFLPNSSYVTVIGIVNVKLGLGDDRYGEATDLQEYISTGTKYTFTAAEVATLEGGGDVVLGNLDVWGGDCVVSAHTFKVCDSTYSVANQNKHIGSAQSTDDLISKWNGVLYKNIAEDCFLSLPVSVENCAQYVQVVLESEYNGSVLESDILEGSSASIPVMTGQVSNARTPLTYLYNLNLNKQNSQKIYVPDPQFSFKQSEFGSRVHWTDLKIYNSDQQGFDIFRVADFFDIEEKYRPITKLALAGDNLYSIHEQGVIYLPTGEKQIEQADGGTLAVRSGEVIGQKIIIDSERGCQHLRGIVETGGVVYVPDNRNKTVYALSGQQLIPIIKDNETIFRSFFSTVKDTLIGVYDPYRRHYWIADGTDCHVFNEKGGFWVSNYTLDVVGSAATNQKLYIIGVNGTDTSIYSMYTGPVGSLCGASVESDVTFVVNPLPDFSKTFDNFMANASERLSSIDFAVYRESAQGNQTGTASLDIESFEGNFRVKNPRDSNSARLRGLYLQGTITWKAVQSVLRAAYTKYRMSARTPW